MAISKDETRRVAELARLELSEEEEELFAGQLGAVLDYIGQLNELDTEDVEPMAGVLDLKNVFREDRVGQKFAPNAWSSNAPSSDQGHFRVPRIIEG